jgi:uncharacterized protein YbjT (DUF2867 family)
MFVILGATGNTGSVVARKLLEKGAKVRAVGRDAARLAPLTQQGAEAFTADANDAAALTKAFSGAEAAYLLLPPQITAPDLLAVGEKITDAITEAVKASGLTRAVLLSSIGAQHDSKTGPIVTLHRFEQKLNQVGGLHALYLRPVFFMENFLMLIGMIQSMGLMGGGIKGDLKMPMIATRDIGEAAADALLGQNFQDKKAKELLGQRDLTHEEAAHALGAEIGKPKLSYQRFPGFMVEQAMKHMGVPGKTASLMTEMNEAANDGLLDPIEPRSASNTTPTSIETFAKEVFGPAFRAKAATA